MNQPEIIDSPNAVELANVTGRMSCAVLLSTMKAPVLYDIDLGIEPGKTVALVVPQEVARPLYVT